MVLQPLSGTSAFYSRIRQGKYFVCKLVNRSNYTYIIVQKQTSTNTYTLAVILKMRNRSWRMSSTLNLSPCSSLCYSARGDKAIQRRGFASVTIIPLSTSLKLQYEYNKPSSYRHDSPAKGGIIWPLRFGIGCLAQLVMRTVVTSDGPCNGPKPESPSSHGPGYHRLAS